MLSSAVVFAVGVAAAVCNALGAVLCADVVRDCLRVLGSVGGDVVLADAGVVERLGVTVVLRWKVSGLFCSAIFWSLYIPRQCRKSWQRFGDRSKGRHTAGWCTRFLWQVRMMFDDGDRLISQTSSGLGDIGHIDSVLGLSRGQLGDHGKEEETDTTHLDRFSV